MSERGRPLAARVLVVLACVVLVLALVAGYVRLTVIDSDQFANRATAALRDDSVKSLIAEKITDEVVLKNEADLIAARPIIESVASEIVGGRAFTSLFRAAVRDVHARRLRPRQEHRHAHGRGRRDGAGGRAPEAAALAREAARATAAGSRSSSATSAAPARTLARVGDDHPRARPDPAGALPAAGRRGDRRVARPAAHRGRPRDRDRRASECCWSSPTRSSARSRSTRSRAPRTEPRQAPSGTRSWRPPHGARGSSRAPAP